MFVLMPIVGLPLAVVTMVLALPMLIGLWPAPVMGLALLGLAF